MTVTSPAPDYRFGRFLLQPAAQRLLVDGKAATLGPRAFDLLVALVERAGQLVSKAELLDRVWPGLVVEENNLQVQVSALRKILGPDAIATIPGRGYRFTLQPEPAGSPQHAPAVATPPAPSDAEAPSIAVLPFVNISDDAANEYFADGLSEELLNVLSKIRGLRVASRTSAFSFKGVPVDIPTAARKLNVATILEGSVRKAGSRVRITAQLVHVATDSHLWSQTYDRELEDIFAVQDDIAHAVVTEMRGALMHEGSAAPGSAQVTAEVQSAVKGRSRNAEAYRLHLQGTYLHEPVQRGGHGDGHRLFPSRSGPRSGVCVGLGVAFVLLPEPGRQRLGAVCRGRGARQGNGEASARGRAGTCGGSLGAGQRAHVLRLGLEGSGVVHAARVAARAGGLAARRACRHLAAEPRSSRGSGRTGARGHWHSIR